jgi:hypothetical protein
MATVNAVNFGNAVIYILHGAGICASHPLRGVHNMAAFIAKYVSSHLGPNNMSPYACTILLYIPTVLHLEYIRREGHAEERAVRTQHLPTEMPGFQETVTQKPKEICGCCFQNFIHQLKQFFLHISGNVAVVLRTSHLQSDFT